MEFKRDYFYDELSKRLYHEVEWKLRTQPQHNSSRVMIELATFSVAESYVTSKVVNRHGDTVKVNIEGGRLGIDLQETLLEPRGQKLTHAYLVTDVKQDATDSSDDNRGQSRTPAWRQQCNTTTRTLVRCLPILGVKDWLLIYEDTLFLLAVKDAYEEIEIIAFPDS